MGTIHCDINSLDFKVWQRLDRWFYLIYTFFIDLHIFIYRPRHIHLKLYALVSSLSFKGQIGKILKDYCARALGLQCIGNWACHS